MGKSSRAAKVEMCSNPEEDEFWMSLGQSMISDTINVLDSRAQFMITTSASLLVIDFTVLLVASKVALLTVSPQFFFALSALCFILSLFPKRYKVNPWVPDETRSTYYKILNDKHWRHIFGFSFFLLGLVSVAISSFFTVA